LTSPTRQTGTSLEATIGLEVHAQLSTRSKIFCACPTTFGSPPNAQTCPVCLGHPGALPVLNAQAVALAVRGALALGCEVHETSVFARKHYFYPDLPKGYQISQYEQPLATGGTVPIELPGGPHSIGLSRLHLEEDAGKLVHEGLPDCDRYSYVDLNRAGVPLIEIVSRPELRSPAEAYLFLQRLRSILRYVGVCDGNMEQGSLRCDANVSVRPAGERKLGTRTELKNLNSFRNVQRALVHEIERQIAIVTAGGEVEQQTVLWDAEQGVTRPMRGKEEAQDYRYYPDPDLGPLVCDPAWVREIAAGLPELPAARKRRLLGSSDLTEVEAHLLTLERDLADYFEEVAAASGNAKATANFLLNDLQREQNLAGAAGAGMRPPAEHLARLVRLVDSGRVSITVARRELFGEMFRGGRPPEELLRERGLEQVGDEDLLVPLVRSVLERFPAQLAQYRAGKTGLFGFFVGHVMRDSKGKADPKRVAALLEEEIG
jgi:aspartyl-tRNA(Asn)/glutamyl-tRNA(Gln) amidotransferase subunit B